MTYEAQAQLEADPTFRARAGSANVQQANVYKDSQLGDHRALAGAVIRGELQPGDALVRLDAAGPGIADKVTTPDGIDQSQVTDDDLLALTQANWPTVAGLYYTAEGEPIP